MMKIDKLFLRFEQTRESHDPNRLEKMDIITRQIVRLFVDLNKANHIKN